MDQLDQQIWIVQEPKKEIAAAQLTSEAHTHEKKYFKFKFIRIKNQYQAYSLIKITDATLSIWLEESRRHNKFLQMVNACVSHEMRNPINSIFAMNIQLQDQAQELSVILEELRKAASTGQINKATLQKLYKDCSEIQRNIQKHAKIQQSSTKLVNFYVADLLCLSQIDQGKFRKNIEQFNIKDAIEEIIQV